MSLAPQDLDLCSTIKCLSAFGVSVALVRAGFVVVEDVAHRRRSHADLRHHHMAADGFGVLEFYGPPNNLRIATSASSTLSAVIFR